MHTHVILAPGAWNLGLEVLWLAMAGPFPVQNLQNSQNSGRLVFEQHSYEKGTFCRNRTPAQGSGRLVFDQHSYGLGTFCRNWRPRGLRHRVPGGLFLNNTHMKRGHFVGIGGSGGSGSLVAWIPWIPRKKTNIGARKLFCIDFNGFPSPKS